MNASDAALVKRTRGGDRDAYGEMVTRYQGHVYGLAYTLVNNRSDAQDIAQEAFVRAYLNLDQLRDPGRFAPWMRRVTFSVAMNWLKVHRPRLHDLYDGRIDLDILEIPDFRPGPSEEMKHRELAQAVQEAVASLPPKYRVPLTMFHLDGLSYRKVADFLDIPLGTAKSLISRARGRLRAALDGYYHHQKELTAMVAEVFEEHKLTTEFSSKVLRSIAGVRRLRWGEWRDCTYGGAIAALMNTVGAEVTYEEVMGLSGACYRICMKEDWCPSAGMPQCGYDVETPLYRALGFAPYSIADESERRQKVKECLDKGIPVLCCGQRAEPEWGIITGYAKGEEVFFGRTYFDYGGAKESEVFAEDEYYLADRFPGQYPEALMKFFDKRCEAISPKEALKQSLETCIGTLRQGPGDHGYVRGYEAYELWVRGLEDEAEFDEFPAGTNGYHLDMLRDARRCAYIYLEQGLELVSHSNRGRLGNAVELFRSMFDGLMTFAPYQGTDSSFNGRLEDWGMDRRRELAAVLRELCAMERQVEATFQTILGEWG